MCFCQAPSLPVTDWSPADVASFLRSLKLGQYCQVIEDEHIDGSLFLDVIQSDPTELGIDSKLHVRKIRTSLAALSQSVDSSILTEQLKLMPDTERTQHFQEILDNHKRGRWFLEHLGKGGSGFVYKATDTRFGVVALKLIAVQGEKERKAFDREVNATKRCADNASVCNIKEYFIVTNASLVCIVMEFVAGGSLEQQLAKAPGRRLSEEKVVVLCEALLPALEHVHKMDILHRDITPSNILFTEDGSVKLCDFGISVAARSAQDISKSLKTGTVGLQRIVGTPHYMSPEQVAHNKEVDKRTDIWSVGVVIFETLTGRKPFGEGSENFVEVGASILKDQIPEVHDKNPDVSDVMNRFVRRAMHREQGDRFQSVTEMRSAFAKDLGCKNIGCAYVVHGRRQGRCRLHSSHT